MDSTPTDPNSNPETYSKPNLPVFAPLYPSPIRILVKTLTHLVPSDGVVPDAEDDLHADKLISMLDRICKHVWGCPYEPGNHRWYAHGDDEFGYNNRLCFFLVDLGTAPEGGDEDVEVRAFEWDGSEFKPNAEMLQIKDIQDELKETPFTPKPRSKPGQSDEGEDKPSVREMVRMRLRGLERVPNSELEYVRSHPEDMEWLKRKLRPRFYESLLKQIEDREMEMEMDHGEKESGEVPS
ncbi:uncharacterized protein DSM5745_01028 [Aspergillus mulundensis]|uniref:Uncharacterized protein n=1 Tax=Aspergillus mulundensis TaxID=1810919 RepID=A0A3D8T566_9EURO|nr:Uncharacterized protein DSM5745_01028 [Aspergillus mulundensis]RDW93706.1 Uncharacterized protein DSM5745_01028 [Aspergillus mulundensis]